MPLVKADGPPPRLRPHDLLIGAAALAQGHTLATLNTTEFSRAAGLRRAAIGRFFS